LEAMETILLSGKQVREQSPGDGIGGHGLKRGDTISEIYVVLPG
jgi:hypothetical protein